MNVRRISTIALGLFALGIIVVMIVPTRYAATALVVVDPREQRVTSEQDVLPGIGQDAAALQSLIEIAKSDGFLRPLIEQLKVAEDEEISRGETEISRLLEKFRTHLDISRRGLTYVIAMTFLSKSPQRAAYYANAIAEAFVASQRQVRTDATDDAAGWLNSRLKILNDRLRASEDAVAEFKLQHKIVNAGRESTTQQLRVTELSQQVSAARLRTEEAKTRYEQAQRDLKANVDGPVKQDLLSMLRAQRSQLNDQIAQKKTVLGERHPDLVMSYGQLGELNRQIETERKRNIETAKSDFDTLLDQQKSLEGQLRSVEAQMLADGQAFVKLQELQRDADANKNLYEQFLSRAKTTSEQRLLQSSQTKIASFAIPPTRPTRPPLSLILAALAIASILTSTAVVALLNRSGSVTGLASPPLAALPSQVEVETPLNVPVWGRIPDLRPPKAATTAWQNPGDSSDEIDLGTYLRELLDALAGAPNHRGKVVLVTSIERGAGTSSVARSLNLAAVERGMFSVLIQVQADRISGRSMTIPGEQSASHRLRASKASIAGVNRLFSGGRHDSVSSSEDIRSEFDLIVIDAPPLHEQVDVATISAHADLAILVVQARGTDVATVNNAKTELSKFGTPAIGAVINQIDAQPIRRLEAAC
jgi:polysaccharide biosynthesis transport protein